MQRFASSIPSLLLVHVKVTLEARSSLFRHIGNRMSSSVVMAVYTRDNNACKSAISPRPKMSTNRDYRSGFSACSSRSPNASSKMAGEIGAGI